MSSDCPECGGSGEEEVDDDHIDCKYCVGRGEVPDCPECGAAMITLPPLEDPRQWNCVSCPDMWFGSEVEDI